MYLHGVGCCNLFNSFLGISLSAQISMSKIMYAPEQSYTCISDIARAIIKAALVKAIEIFNMRLINQQQWRCLVKKIVKTFGLKKVMFFNKHDPLEYQKARYSSHKALLLLDWSPTNFLRKINIKEITT